MYKYVSNSAFRGNFYPATNGHFYFVTKERGSVEVCREICRSKGAEILEVRTDAQFEVSRDIFLEHFGADALEKCK